MQSYQAEIEQAMKKYYATLAEKDQRLYAAVEALKLGRGGQRYIAELLGCSERTVSRGLEDLAGLPEQPKPELLQRKLGGGRNRYDETHPNIDVQIRIAHYPPCCSKFNPVEHRLFPHVTRACQCVIFTSVGLVK